MFKPVRIVATIVFLGSIGLVLVGAFVLQNAVSIFFLCCNYYYVTKFYFLPRQILCIGMLL